MTNLKMEKTIKYILRFSTDRDNQKARKVIFLADSAEAFIIDLNTKQAKTFEVDRSKTGNIDFSDKSINDILTFGVEFMEKNKEDYSTKFYFEFDETVCEYTKEKQIMTYGLDYERTSEFMDNDIRRELGELNS